MNRFRQILAGMATLASLTVLLFMLLRWRSSSPEQHMDLDGGGENQSSEQNDE